MLGYNISLYLKKDVGDKFIKVLEELENHTGKKMKVSDMIKRGISIYSEALQIFLENEDKFLDIDEFDEWLIEVIKDLKSKVIQVPAEDFKKMVSK